MPVSDITGAIDLRRRRRRRRNWIIAAVVAGVLVLAGVAVWVVRSSSLLCVEQIDVEGTHTLTPSQVVTAAGVTTGVPLARVDTGQVVQQVSTLPPVSAVEVHRSWPHTLTISVTERTLVYQVEVSGSYLSVDPDGVVFNRSTTRARGAVRATTASGDRTLLRDVATVVGSFPTKLRSQVDHVDAKSRDSIVVVLTGGRSVVWGSADRSELKGQVAAAMLGVRATHYDVSSPEHPTSR